MTRRERLERKLELRREWADKAKAKAESHFNAAHRIGDIIPTELREEREGAMNRAQAHKLVACGVIKLGDIRTILREVNPHPSTRSSVNRGMMQTDALEIFRRAIAEYKEIPDAHVMDGQKRNHSRDEMIAANIIWEFGVEGIAAILRQRP